MLISNRLVVLAVTLAVGLTKRASGQQGGVSAEKWPTPERIAEPIPNNNRAQTQDPALIRRASDNKLFLYTTGQNGHVWTADSLHGPWTDEGSARLPETGGAPSIHMVDDTYYMYYNSHNFDYEAAGVDNDEAQTFWHGAALNVTTSKTLEVGSWAEPRRLNITWAMKYNILDAALLTVGSGKGGDRDGGRDRQHLLTFGSYQDGIFQMPLADPPVEIAPGANGMETALANFTMEGFPTGPTEAGYVYRHGEFYYLFFSSGKCCRNKQGVWAEEEDVYKVMVCRSKEPGTGYKDRDNKSCVTENGGTKILGTHGNIWAPGGQGVIDDEEAGGPIMYYHYVPYNVETKTPEKAYRFGWNKLDFSDGGWPALVKG